MDGLEKEIRGIALQNASEHGGQTQDKIVLGKILSIRPDLRSRAKEITTEIAGIVAKVNMLTPDEQRKELEAYPELLTPKEKIQEREGLPELKGAQYGAVVTRFPPEPNGYPHIGHAKAAIINSEYAKMYGGKFILRMDDTNPETERMEYHAAIKVGLEWLGIEIDETKNTSDDMELFYEKGIQLIESDMAYVCTCKRDDISKNRRERRACKCSRNNAEKNAKNWEKMNTKLKPGEAIVRFRGDMKADNAVMRDPVLFRIITEKHYTLGEKYRVWPSYDMAVAVEDSADGVTHAFRSKEFELREELTNAILDALEMRRPCQGFFSRLEFKGMPTSKRVIRPLIEDGRVSWYDDPRLPTLEALKRRGIKSEAVRKFVMSLGMTKANTLAPFESLEAFNRKIVDPKSRRLFMVINARKLAVSGLPITSVDIPNHPVNDMGSRTIPVDGNFYVTGEDVSGMRPGMQVRLLGIGNVTITGSGTNIASKFAGEEMSDAPKIQWVTQNTAHKIKVIVPDTLFDGERFDENSLKELDVYTEPHYLQLKEGEEIQFVRFGYCRKDSQTQAIFTHK